MAIVAFSDSVRTPSGTVYTSTCYRTELAKASSQNKEYLRNFISSLSARGGTIYTKALDTAFDYFANSPNISVEGMKRGENEILLFYVIELIDLFGLHMTVSVGYIISCRVPMLFIKPSSSSK